MTQEEKLDEDMPKKKTSVEDVKDPETEGGVSLDLGDASEDDTPEVSSPKVDPVKEDVVEPPVEDSEKAEEETKEDEPVVYGDQGGGSYVATGGGKVKKMFGTKS